MIAILQIFPYGRVSDWDIISEEGACGKNGCHLRLVNGGEALHCFDFHRIPQGVLGG